MNKITVIIGVIIVIIIALFIAADDLSMHFAKDKPDDILYLHPEFSDMIAKNESKPKNLICFYRNNDGVKIKKLYKKSFLNYSYTDDVATDYVIKDGKVIGAYGEPGNIPSVTKSLTLDVKNVEFETLDKKTIEFRFIRAIVPSAESTDEGITSSHRSILCCELTGDINDYIIYYSKNKVRAHRIFNKVINNKTYLVFNIMQDDLISIDDIDNESFFIEVQSK